MDKERNDMTEKILTLTLEIIYLLTGEDYAPVKSCMPHVGSIFHTSWRSQRTQSRAMDHSSSRVHEKNNDEKILDLTNKIIHLVTGEVPVRYEDITVSFSMEEWEYVEGHKELYKEVITEDQELDSSKDFNREETEVEDDRGLPSPPCVTKDASDLQAKACRKPSTWRKPRRRRAKFTSKHRDKIAVFKNIPTDDNPPGKSTINGGSCTNDDGNFTSDVTTNGHHPCSSNKVPPVNDESDHTGGTHTGDDVDVKPSHPEFSSSFREPPVDTPYTPAPYVNTPIKEEPVPNGGPTLYPSAYNQEESWPKTNDTGADIYAMDRTQYTLAHIKTETVLREEDDGLNSSTHTPPDHVQRGYTQIKVEPVSQEEGYELYIPTDSSQRLHTSAHGQATKRPKEHPKTPENSPCMNRLAKQVVDGMYVCSTCEKSFTSQFGLVKHQAMHNGNKVSCPQCGKLFFYKSSLVIHQRIHTGEKLFACPVCNKCFTNNSNLVVHQRIHTGEKPFVCSECGKRFGHKGHLNRHLRTHETEKPDANVENFVDNRLQNHWNPHKMNGWTFNIYDTGPYSTYDKSV